MCVHKKRLNDTNHRCMCVCEIFFFLTRLKPSFLHRLRFTSFSSFYCRLWLLLISFANRLRFSSIDVLLSLSYSKTLQNRCTDIFSHSHFSQMNFPFNDIHSKPFPLIIHIKSFIVGSYRHRRRRRWQWRW